MHFLISLLLTVFRSLLIHLHGNTASKLDLSFTNSLSLLHSVHTVPGISEHECVVTSLSSPRPYVAVTRPRKVYFFEQGDYCAIRYALERHFDCFSMLSLTATVSELWTILKPKIFTLPDLHDPSKVLAHKQKRNKPWFATEMKTLINRRKRL